MLHKYIVCPAEQAAGICLCRFANYRVYTSGWNCLLWKHSAAQTLPSLGNIPLLSHMALLRWKLAVCQLLDNGNDAAAYR